MIFLVTGLPGHGKTYFTIAKAIEVIGASGRPVFYSGISDLKLEWTESDPRQWFKLQDGSVFVMDEAQKVFPVPPVGAPRGQHVTELETHRHRGFDLWIITQDANLLDSHVRRLVGVHYHVHRPFGMPFVNVYQWDGVHNPRDYHDKQKAVTSKFRLTSKVWNLYKSATQHTVRMRIPWKLVLLLVGVVAIPIIAFGVWSLMGGLSGDAKRLSREARGVSPPRESDSAPVPRLGGGLWLPRQASIEEWSSQFAPRVVDIPATAPRYDDFTKAQVAPIVRGCIEVLPQDSYLCRCYADNGAALPVSETYCRRVIRNGFEFRDHGIKALHRDGEQEETPRKVERKAPPPMLPERVQKPRSPLQASPVPIFGKSSPDA